MLPNQAKCRAQLTTGQTVVLGQLDLGFQPDFSLPVRAVNVNMDPSFLTREKVETKATPSKDGRTHQPESYHQDKAKSWA